MLRDVMVDCFLGDPSKILLRSMAAARNLLPCKRKNRLAGRFDRRLSQLAGCLTR